MNQCVHCGIELYRMRECSDPNACAVRAEPSETFDEIDARIERWQARREDQDPPRRWDRY